MKSDLTAVKSVDPVNDANKRSAWHSESADMFLQYVKTENQ